METHHNHRNRYEHYIRRTENFIYVLTYILTLWFLATCWLWPNFINLRISYPVGFLAFLLWLAGRNSDPNGERYAVIGFMLLGGMLVSFALPAYIILLNLI